MRFGTLRSILSVQRVRERLAGLGFSYLAGLALAAPFLRSALTPILAIPLFLHALRYRATERPQLPVPAIVWVVGLIAIFHVLGLARSETPFAAAIWKELAVSTCLVAVFLIAWFRSPATDDAPAAFFAPIAWLAVLFSLFGLFKAALFERGVVLSLGPNPLTQYTAGASLIGDYNLFGLILVVGAIGLIRNLPAHWSRDEHPIRIIIALAIVLAAAAASGSRRTLLLIAMLPVLWIIFVGLTEPRPRLVRRAAVQLIMTGLTAAALFWAIQSSDRGDEYVIWPPTDQTATTADSDTTPGPDRPRAHQAEPLPNATLTDAQVVNNATLTDLLSTLGPQGEYGFGSRTERWRLGWDIVRDDAFWTGTGFAYHGAFSCRFTGCAVIDYPHSPILSEWLIAGVLGAFAGLAYFGLAGLAVWRMGRRGWWSGVTPALLVTLPSILISGDTLLSTPQFLAVTLLAHLVARSSGMERARGA